LLGAADVHKGIIMGSMDTNHKKTDDVNNYGNEKKNLIDRFETLLDISISLSGEKDPTRLLEQILLGAKRLTNADGGTLYTITAENTLRFEIVRTTSLNLHLGGTSSSAVNFPEIPLYLNDGTPNKNLVSAYSALYNVTINIPDVYDAKGFDFYGTKKFDEQTGYRSQSFLTIPMTNHEGAVIGILQLLNAQDISTGDVKEFALEDQRLALALASQAAVALSNQNLISNLKNMFEGFVKSINHAIDDKSPHTSDHCKRVPVVAMMLAEAVNDAQEGPYKGFEFSDQELHELYIASLLHDCGKIATPSHIIDKTTKLETIYDKVHCIDLRFDHAHTTLERDYYEDKLKELTGKPPTLPQHIQQVHEKLENDRAFIHDCNTRRKPFTPSEMDLLESIYRNSYSNVIDDEEYENLSIIFGNLSEEERTIIRQHVASAGKMLEDIPYPEHLKRIPEFVTTHHERLNGTGYPQGLSGDDISLQSRILCIADVFEALTSAKRPYKDRMNLSTAINILKTCVEKNELDKDLLKTFLTSKIHIKYAQEHLSPEQIDLSE
jgi:HD-GYP domain-containing protein (c-di-GMP phosphodiesterase class II)